MDLHALLTFAVAAGAFMSVLYLIRERDDEPAPADAALGLRADLTDRELRTIALRCGGEALRHCGPLQDRCKAMIFRCWLPKRAERTLVVRSLWAELYALADAQDPVVRAAVLTVLHAVDDAVRPRDAAREACLALTRLSGMVVDVEPFSRWSSVDVLV